MVKVVFFVLSIVSISCEEIKKETDNSKDFTKKGLFTSGIEGPAVDVNGYLYAVNFKEEGTIGVVDQKGKATLFTRLPQGSIGNGIRFDQNGHMYIADYTNHNVLIIKKGETQAQVYAHEPLANQPNDLAIAPNGILFASDPNWSENTGQLWRVDKQGFTLLESGMGTTNGIEVDPTATKLYVNESVQRKIWVYNLDPQGNISDKKLFYQFKDYGLDGMRCDNQGNLYVCRYDAGKVVVISPKGVIIREVLLKGKKPTNITFGSQNKKQCFVTLADRGCFETFYADYPGKKF